MVCKGLCIKYKIKKPQLGTDGRYKGKAKRCSMCTVFIKWDKIRCPCCGSQLRLKPRAPRDSYSSQSGRNTKRM